jgi:hypothetical protein
MPKQGEGIMFDRRFFYLGAAVPALVAGSVFASAQAAQIDAVFSDSALTTLTIEGSGFGASRPKVRIANERLVLQSFDSNRIVALLPPGIKAGSYLLNLDIENVTRTFDVSIGTQGGVGPKGPAGPQGPTGAKGAAGAQGTAGPRGSIGPTGAQGPQGVAGPSGPTGATGASVTLVYGTLVASYAGDDDGAGFNVYDFDSASTPGQAILFDTPVALTSSGIAYTSPSGGLTSGFTVAASGLYEVSFAVDADADSNNYDVGVTGCGLSFPALIGSPIAGTVLCTLSAGGAVGLSLEPPPVSEVGQYTGGGEQVAVARASLTVKLVDSNPTAPPAIPSAIPTSRHASHAARERRATPTLGPLEH